MTEFQEAFKKEFLSDLNKVVHNWSHIYGLYEFNGKYDPETNSYEYNLDNVVGKFKIKIEVTDNE